MKREGGTGKGGGPFLAKLAAALHRHELVVH